MRCNGANTPAYVSFVRGDPGAAVLAWQGRTFALEQTVSGSGVRYADTAAGGEETVLFTKGREALFEQPGASQLQCALTPTALPVFVATDWRLVEIVSMDDAQGTSRPEDPDKYTLQFGIDGRAAVRLDCNRGAGTWTGDGASRLSFGPLATTRAACRPPSLGDQLGMMLSYVRSYVVADGRLHMSLMADGGILVWEPRVD